MYCIFDVSLKNVIKILKKSKSTLWSARIECAFPRKSPALESLAARAIESHGFGHSNRSIRMCCSSARHVLLLRGVALEAHVVEAGLTSLALRNGVLGALVERPEQLVASAELASERLRLTQLHSAYHRVCYRMWLRLRGVQLWVKFTS